MFLNLLLLQYAEINLVLHIVQSLLLACSYLLVLFFHHEQLEFQLPLDVHQLLFLAKKFVKFRIVFVHHGLFEGFLVIQTLVSLLPFHFHGLESRTDLISDRHNIVGTEELAVEQTGLFKFRHVSLCPLVESTASRVDLLQTFQSIRWNERAYLVPDEWVHRTIEESLSSLLLDVKDLGSHRGDFLAIYLRDIGPALSLNVLHYGMSERVEFKVDLGDVLVGHDAAKKLSSALVSDGVALEVQ